MTIQSAQHVENRKTQNGKPANGRRAKRQPKLKEAPQQSWAFGKRGYSHNHKFLGRFVAELRIAAHTEHSTPLPAKTGELLINPETARSWLKRNRENRPISLPLVRFLMREIEEDRWIMNGQTISFKASGELNDGQHRLIACVLSAKPMPSVVAVNVPEKAFVTVDTGRPRRATDILALAGYQSTSAIASAIRWDVAYQRGNLSWKIKRPMLRLSNQEILEGVNERPWLQELAARYYSHRIWIKLMAPSLFVFTLGRLQQIDRPAAESFFSQLGSGANLEPRSPILALRERLLEDRALDRQRVEEGTHLGYIIKAWNAWYEGRELERMFARANDKFPDFATVRKR